jgi:hypothetical protein
MLQFFMRQKSTIYSPEFHNQFQQTPDKIKEEKREKAEHVNRDEKQGQGEFRIKKEISK